MSSTWTTDRGVAEGVASVDPGELHRGMAHVTMAALRNGVPAEWLDAVAAWRTDRTLGVIGTSDQLRRDHLATIIHGSKRTERNARRNANAANSKRLAANFLDDAAQALEARQRAERELADLDAGTSQWCAPNDFEEELDFFARALANFASIEGAVEGKVVHELEHIFEFSGIDVSAYPHARFEFYARVPALGRVLRLGPMYCVVRNRGYPARMPDDLRPDTTAAARLVPSRSASRSDAQIADDIRALLEEEDWTTRAAGVASRSQFAPIIEVLRHQFLDEPLPDGIDPRYARRCIEIYRNPEFAWKPGRHLIDCRYRQALVDAVLEAGGEMTMADAEQALATTPVDRVRIAVFSRPQVVGSSPPWLPCVRRTGDWTRGRPMTSHGVAVSDCRHCGAKVDLVVRVPEVPECLLCSTCLRAPSRSSPTYPEAYRRLRSTYEPVAEISGR